MWQHRPIMPEFDPSAEQATSAGPDTSSDRVTVVVALKNGPHAKSRLSGLPDPVRRRLAWTMAVDTLLACAAAAEVIVVSRQPAVRSRLIRAGVRARVVSEAGPGGLNAALQQGAVAAGGRVLACVGDLPALRPDDVLAVIAASSASERVFLADASGIGTTMLLAPATELEPRFGGRSAAAHHASGARALDFAGGGRARRDVDTEVDLADAVRLGVGPTTGALIDPATGRVGQYEVVTVTDWVDATGTRQVVSGSGRRLRLPPEATLDSLRGLRLGQRLHSVTGSTGVLSAWV